MTMSLNKINAGQHKDGAATPRSKVSSEFRIPCSTGAGSIQGSNKKRSFPYTRNGVGYHLGLHTKSATKAHFIPASSSISHSR